MFVKGVVSSLPCASFRSFGQYALASSHWENDKEGKMSFKNYVAFKRGIPPPSFRGSAGYRSLSVSVATVWQVATLNCVNFLTFAGIVSSQAIKIGAHYKAGAVQVST